MKEYPFPYVLASVRYGESFKIFVPLRVKRWTLWLDLHMFNYALCHKAYLGIYQAPTFVLVNCLILSLANTSLVLFIFFLLLWIGT